MGSEDLRILIQEKTTTPHMVRLALEQGMSTLVQDGIHKVLDGHTTFQQVLRVAMK
jgi:type II secretory ATPase GspE/PulE/Tfp pilus assembly ATPase PilB-like protein